MQSVSQLAEWTLKKNLKNEGSSLERGLRDSKKMAEEVAGVLAHCYLGRLLRLTDASGNIL